MAGINQEIINPLTEMQNAIWESASSALAEAGIALKLDSPLALASKVTDLSEELSGPLGLIQFSFAQSPDAFQLVVIRQDTLLGLATMVTGEAVAELDENTVALLRPSMEAIVQGMCLGIGNARGMPVAASGLTIRYQDLVLPANFEALDELVRVQVAVSGEGVSGAAIWLIDPDTASFICSEEEPLTALDSPFEQIGSASTAPGHGYSGDTGIEFLMDIPLEISVELGRVKMLVRDVVELGTGSIVEIDKAAGEPVDVMVNGRLVAKGEVVVIEDNFAVRITEIVTPQERLMRLAEVA